MTQLTALRICLVAPEHNAGCEEVYADFIRLSAELATAGHRVTLMCASSIESPHAGIEVERIPNRLLQSQYRNTPHLTRSYETYLHLKEKSFDVIYFAERLGLAYYCLLAKRQGLAFATAQLQVATYGASFAGNAARGYFPYRASELILNFTEKTSVELCDLLIIRDDAHRQSMLAEGWKLSANFTTTQEAVSAIADVHQRPLMEIETESKPLVSVCLAHFNRPHYLRQAIESLEQQDYPNYEVILVDDGSNTPEALHYLEELDSRFAERGWQLIRQKNSYLGATRNKAVKHACGEYVLLMDDDNYAEPYEISRFVMAAQRTGADILTCALKIFQGDAPPELSKEPISYNNPYLCDAPIVGLYHQGIGDANSLIRRSVYLEMGGFPEDRDYSASDQEFFARAMLAGFRLETVPEALAWYRVGHACMRAVTPPYLNQVRSVRPFIEALPQDLESLALLSFGLTTRNETLDDLQLACYQGAKRYRHNTSALNTRLTTARSLLLETMRRIKLVESGAEVDGRAIQNIEEDLRGLLQEISMNTPNNKWACNLDAIEGTAWSSQDEEARLTQNELVTLRGWAFDPCTSKLAADVSLVIDNKVVASALYGLSRIDVAMHFRLPEIENSGFRVGLNCSTLEAGRHEAKIRVMGSDLRHYHESTPIRLNIISAPVRCMPRVSESN